MQLLRITKSKKTEDENGENALHLEITEAVLVHCKVINDDYQQNSKAFHTSVLNNLFG